MRDYMLWFILACNTNEKIPNCQPVSSIEIGTSNTLTLGNNSCSSLQISPEIFGSGDMSIRFEEIDGGGIQPIVRSGANGAVFEALILSGNFELRGSEEPLRIWKQGYQSWWWSGVTELEPIQFDDNGIPMVGGDGNGTSATEETPYTSWWNGLIGRNGGQSILIGALSSERLPFWTAFSSDTLWAVWGGRRDRLTIPPDSDLSLDPLWISSGNDPFQLHRDYASATAKHQRVEIKFERPPIGWATWYTFYSEINEEIIQNNLTAAVELQSIDGTAPLDLIQIDDGWQKHWGEWEANSEFPSGMSALASEINRMGFLPGLWMAPFYVSTESTIFSEHDDWWVKDDLGEPILFSNLGVNSYAIIDVTHPDAGAWMQQVVSEKKLDGWDYLKLDFLYAGAQSGQRHADVSGIEAYHIGMSLLREAVGDGFFLACGAPMLPSVGYADGFRTGADIGFDFDPGPRHEYLRWQVRATAARSWQNGVWWWNDPDQILLRAPFDSISRSGALVANVISGGAWLLGDDLSTLDPDILASGLAELIVDTRGEVGQPMTPLFFPSGPDIGPVSELGDPDDRVPIMWELSDGTIAAINMSDDSIEITAPSGYEYFSGETTEEGDTRALSPGQGELWLSGHSN
jgi:hypothetical protein